MYLFFMVKDTSQYFFWQTDKEPRTKEKIARANRSELYVFFGASLLNAVM